METHVSIQWYVQLRNIYYMTIAFYRTLWISVTILYVIAGFLWSSCHKKIIACRWRICTWLTWIHQWYDMCQTMYVVILWIRRNKLSKSCKSCKRTLLGSVIMHLLHKLGLRSRIRTEICQWWVLTCKGYFMQLCTTTYHHENIPLANSETSKHRSDNNIYT